MNLDGFAKILKASLDVIPAKAGNQYFQVALDACLRRHDGFWTIYGFVNLEL